MTDIGKCEIAWLDHTGRMTPDDNMAIGRIRLRARVYYGPYGPVHLAAAPWLRVCREHAQMLENGSIPGADNWEWEDSKPTAPPPPTAPKI